MDIRWLLIFVGHTIPKQLARIIKHVDKDEYGPTEVDLEEEYWRMESDEDD
jgi:hypothetical protein